MNCRETQKWISPYLDSELGKTKTFEVSEHLRNCPECATRVEAERNVDEMIRDRLGASGAQMPEPLWSTVERDVATPPWVRRLRRTRTHLALAACLVLALLGTLVFWTPQDETAPPWIVTALAAAAPENHPFPATHDATAEAEAMLRKAFGIRVALDPLDPNANHHFGFHLVSAAHKTDSNGRGFIEVQLNCCGHPVLMVLTKPTDGRLPALFDLPPSGQERYATRIGDVHVEALRTPELAAVVASPHTVSHIVDGLKLIGV